MEVHSKDYRYLTNIVGAAEGIVAKPPKETEMELVLAFLNSIQVGVAYSPRNRALRYEIDSSRELSKVRRRVVITHELIEPIEGSHEECIEVWDGQPKATEVIKSWGKADLFRVSSLIRIACPSLEVETHLIVELDEQFYEGRSRLGVLKYSASEILSSLAQLMEVQIPDENTKKSEVAPSAVFGRQLHVLLDGLRLERYAYQMSRLKIREPNTFNTKKIRVDRLLDELRKNEELRAERSLDLFCESLDKIHGILS
ncbi:MAG: hypothetical protein R3B54_04520 [Bdellovibrionota bacterium]